MSDVKRTYLRLRTLKPGYLTLDVCRRDGEPSASVEVSMGQLHHAICFIESTHANQYAFVCLPPVPEPNDD